MAKKATPIQLIRSEVPGKRPDPQRLLPAQPAANISVDDPGLYIADSANNLVKIGPVGIGEVPPNTGAVEPGALGNCRGELWLDTDPLLAGPTLKVYDGTSWIPAMPPTITPPTTFAAPVIQDTAPATSEYSAGTMWWDSSTGLMYVLYDDGASTQWTQVSASTVS